MLIKSTRPKCHPHRSCLNVLSCGGRRPLLCVLYTASMRSSNFSAVSSAQSVERQSALLSLLGSVSAPIGSDSSVPVPQMPPPMTQHSLTPPPSESRPTGSEAQGKLLLEQLMSGYVLFMSQIYHDFLCLSLSGP